MKKVLSFDSLILFFLIAAFFTVGYHLGGGSDSEVSESILLELSLSVSRGDINGSGTPKIDGRSDATVIFLDENEAHLITKAKRTRAGWLLPSGKYVSENQPIKFYSDTVYIEGRIKSLSKSK